jgi:hypothetical protein
MVINYIFRSREMKKVKKFIDNLYSNVGERICAIAKWTGKLALLDVVVGTVIGVCAFIGGDEEWGLGGLLIAAGGLVVLASTWPLYAFGNITNDIRDIRNKVCEQEDTL